MAFPQRFLWEQGLTHSLSKIDISGWLHQVGAYLSSRQLLELVALQLTVIAAMLLLAWGIRVLTRPWTRELVTAILRHVPTWRFIEPLHRYLPIFYAWLLLAIAAQTAREFGLTLHPPRRHRRGADRLVVGAALFRRRCCMTPW